MKCSNCGKECDNKKLFTECDECLVKSMIKIHHELQLEAFPELNGLPYKEPVNPYAKWIRDCSGIDDDESNK